LKPETRFYLNKVKPALEKIPDLFSEKISQVSIRGFPDVLICYKGQFVVWELKVPPNKVKFGSLQWNKLRSISSAGGLAREVTPQNLDEAIKELKCLDGLKRSNSPYQHPKS
jgi:hypothetical protein